MFGLAVLDELSAGVGTVSAPDLEHAFGISRTYVTSIVFLIPGAIGLVVEPYLFVLADRHPRRWFVRLGAAGMALGALGAALAPGPLALGGSLALLYVAIGIASGLAQATLIDRDPDQRARTIARFTLLSLVGDVAAPVLLAALALAGASWRAAYAIIAAMLAAWALALAVAPIPDRVATPADHRDDELGVIATLRAALANRRLLAWLFAMALCDLLDEIFVVLAALHVRDDLGAGAIAQSAVVVAFVLGGAVGLLALDRLLVARDEHWILKRCALLCALAYLTWLAAPGPTTCILLAFPVGATAAPLYPLASSHAYATRDLTDRATPTITTTTVLAASHLFTPFGLAVPLALGLVADHLGTLTALAILTVEPLGLWLLALRSAGQRGSRRSSSDSPLPPG